MKVSEVRRDNADLRMNVDDDVDDVLTLAEGRGRGQPGEEVMNVFVQHAGHGSPSTPAVDATGALRVARERLSIASNALANVDLSVCSDVLVPARAGMACSSQDTDYAQRIADTPPTYADVRGRMALTAAALDYYEWTPTPLLGQPVSYTHLTLPTILRV